MELLLTGGRVLAQDGVLRRADVLIAGGEIVSVERDVSAGTGARRMDVSGCTLLPGFVDVHVHGGGGFSLATRDPEEIREYARWVVRHGVTSFLATVCAATPRDALPLLEAAAAACGPVEGGATVLGVNLEGPFVNPSRRGALPESWVAAPDVALLGELLDAAGGTGRVMTIAPELPGADAVIEAAASRGVAVSVGHTDADYQAAARAFDAGASHVTHAFNAMRQLHHREPGPLVAALDRDEVTVEVIADGVHLHPAVVSMLARLLGPGRMALVTDAVPPAGAEGTLFRLGDREARVQGGRVTLPDGALAGSAATMDALVRNAVSWGAATLEGASMMASAAPSRAAGVVAATALAPGNAADIVALDAELNVALTVAMGEVAFEGRHRA